VLVVYHVYLALLYHGVEFEMRIYSASCFMKLDENITYSRLYVVFVVVTVSVDLEFAVVKQFYE
jgi:hypothetical protein